MTLPLPRCALCGLPLARHAYTLIETALPGAPSVGWHIDEPDCAGRDLLHRRHVRAREAGKGDVRALIDGVLKRGKDRVRAQALFWKSREGS